MKRFAFVMAVVSLLSLVGFAQSAPNPSTNLPTFALSAKAMSMSGNGETSPATDIGASFALTPHVALRSDNILCPSANTNAYFGGVQYDLSGVLAKELAKTKLSPANFQLYVTGSAGVASITVTGVANQQHFAALAGGGLNYDPAGSGKFSINLIEARWAKLPGFNNSTVIVSSGLQLGF